MNEVRLVKGRASRRKKPGKLTARFQFAYRVGGGGAVVLGFRFLDILGCRV